MTVEDTPRLELSGLRELEAWPALREHGGGKVMLDVGGNAVTFTITLTTDTTSFGQRWWLRCSRCGTRRLHLFVADDAHDLLCRRCLGLLYFEQLLPGNRWRADVGRPGLRQWRRQQRLL